MMLLCTTMGELIGNLISRNFELGYTQGALLDILIFALAIAVSFIIKIKSDIYYWLLILLGNIGGTNIADWVTLEPLSIDKTWGILKPLELGTQVGSLAVLGTLCSILILRSTIIRKTNESHPSSFIFYWLAILLSSTFGTTSGDFITNDTPLGAFYGSIALLILLVIVRSLYKKNRLSGFATYWVALILMHPIGATIGNYVSKPIGLNLGNVYTNAALVILFTILYLQNTKRISEQVKINSKTEE